MELSTVIKSRRSIRRFSNRNIEKEKLYEILDAARIAPSSTNSQPWHFIVIDDKTKIAIIAKAAPIGTRSIISWAKDAPIIIVACYKKKITHHIAEIFGHDNYLIDVTIATDHLILRATDLGIGSCWIGWYNETQLKKLLKIPKGYRIAVLVALGYPEKSSDSQGIDPKPRKALKEIISHNTFGQ